MARFDHFDLIAPHYERFFHAIPDESFFELVAAQTGMLILDVAGGTGRVAQHLTAVGANAVITDISVPMLRQSMQKKGIFPAQTLAERLPFADNVFSRVVMVDALHHVIHQGETIREMLRVLQPGGRLIIEEPDIRNFYVKLIALGEKLLMMRSHFLTGEQISDLFLPLTKSISVQHSGHTVWVVVEKQLAE